MGLKCDWCGRYCHDVKAMVVDTPLKVFPKHFCSNKCKQEYLSSKDGGGENGGIVNGLIKGLFK